MKKQELLFVVLSIVMFTLWHPQVIAQENTNLPKSEWDYAKLILMHTPGQELFDGVIHPAAGLFEDYFDVDKAAEEHQNYISMLRNNGIRVITVADILKEVGMDSLRALASNVLTYDISGLKEPDEEKSEKDRQYVLSRMSRADLVRCILLQPTVHLRSTDNNTGYEATYEHEPFMNLYFTRDQSITTPRGHIILTCQTSTVRIRMLIWQCCSRNMTQSMVAVGCFATLKSPIAG